MKALTKRDARKVLKIVDAGLVSGLGDPVPGQMCVEAAICYALGEPHGDHPKCVAACIRRYKITINDARWSSDQARTAGMRRAAIAQLGSTHIDQQAWASYVLEQVIRRILPIGIRAAATVVKEKDREAVLAAADACEREGSIESARSARKTLYAYAAAAAAAAAAAYAAYADAYADAYAAYADAYADAYAAAYAADAPASGRRDEVLTLAAELCVEACIKFETQGSKWLDITESETAAA